MYRTLASSLLRLRILLLAAGVAFAVFLFVQPGNLLDEPEHLHAAWLIAVRGLRPIHDFFEHHTPVLWWALGLIYRAGIDGPEALYAARVLVLVCAGAWAAMLVVAVRRWSAPEREEGAGTFALASFALTALFAQELMVARPETLSTLALALAILCWTHRSRSIPAAAACGVLFAVSCCSSPRFALFAPTFLIADADGRPALPLPWRRLLAAVAGAGAALAAFIAWLCPWQDLLFDLRFSALLQHVGIAPSLDLRYLAASVLMAVLLWGALLSTARAPRGALAAWSAHGALLWGTCAWTAGKFPYPQAYAPALIWVSLFAAWLEAQPRQEQAAAARPNLRRAALLGTFAVALVQLAAASNTFYSAASLTTSRRMLLDALPLHARVFLLPVNHPITVEDASYCGSLLLDDSPGKICEASAAYNARYPRAAIRLPRCDIDGDLRNGRPAAVSRLLYLIAPPEQVDAVRARLSRDYAAGDQLDEAPARTFAVNILFPKQ